jgi:hypothetical protein
MPLLLAAVPSSNRHVTRTCTRRSASSAQCLTTRCSTSAASGWAQQTRSQKSTARSCPKRYFSFLHCPHPLDHSQSRPPTPNRAPPTHLTTHPVTLLHPLEHTQSLTPPVHLTAPTHSHALGPLDHVTTVAGHCRPHRRDCCRGSLNPHVSPLPRRWRHPCFPDQP